MDNGWRSGPMARSRRFPWVAARPSLSLLGEASKVRVGGPMAASFMRAASEQDFGRYPPMVANPHPSQSLIPPKVKPAIDGHRYYRVETPCCFLASTMKTRTSHRL